jgi:toxin ParE1/3/4
VKVEWSAGAIADLDRFVVYLQDRHPTMARVVGDELTRTSDLLIQNPELGRPLGRRPDRRQLIVRVLNASYVILYRVVPDRVVILRVFHGSEARDR